ncbi:hypothetical protein KP509_01G006900 [Ceratopteris richardii]|uniref:Uncharacterized protein n=1 Tax=Ceratopteris richardii TaxID=49495 RepID=A0A8T2VLR7_CERRI|nr:hypothetical protein KP509_01G006900 [Ceratopteris richardii]
MPFLHKATGLKNIHFFMQVTIQKCCFNVQLMYIPTMMGCKCTDAPNSIHTTCRCKGLIKINASFLCITLCNNPSLIPINNTIRFTLQLVYPLSANGLLAKSY